MAYDLIKISALPAATPDESQDIVVGVGDYAKRINYGDVKADMVGIEPTYTTDTEPYLMRQTAHFGVVGKCALNKLVGGSLAWNQVLSQSGLSNGTTGGITLVKNANGSVTLTGARTGENVNFNVDYVADTIKYQTGHVYYLSWSGISGIGLQIIMESNVGADSLNKNRLIKVAATASTRSWARIRIGTPMNENIGTVTYFPQILDITQMFGATIADYAANLENTYGTGVAWLSKYIDLGTYHAYDAGSIQSVQATAHVTKDANDNVIGNYPLGSDTLRGIPQLVSNKLSYDGDEKLPDGTIKRKYGTKTFNGSENWAQGSGNPNLYYLTLNSTSFPYLFSYEIKAISNLYVFEGAFSGSYATHLTGGDFILYCNPSPNATREIAIMDLGVTTLAAFKSKLSNTPLTVVFETTPSTESSTAFQKIQTIDADGTESFTTSSPVPVGHETQTPDNILAALGWLGE